MELTIEQALQQGVAAHKEGKFEDAERLYRAILRAQPAHPDANHNLGVLAVSINKADTALPLFKTALEASPKVEQFWLSYIDALIKEKQFDNAKQVLEQGKQQGVAGEKLNVLEVQLASISETEKIVSLSPFQTQLSSFSEHYQNGRFGDAERLALSITHEFPKHQLGWKALGAVYGQSGRNSEAVNANQTAVALSPQDAEAHYNLGITLHALGRLDEADVSYRQAIVLKPDDAEAHNNLGAILKELSRLGEAEASYKQAIVLKPDFAEAHSNLGVTLHELGRLDEAETSLKQAIALASGYAEAHSNLGNTLNELGRLNEAEASYTRAIALKPDYAPAHSNLGKTLNALGKLDEAEASYQQAIALAPDFAEAHNNLGVMLQELGRLDEAVASYKQAIALNADSPQLRYNLGVSLQELGRQDEAEASYRQAIALKPDYAEAYNNLGITLQDLGRLQEAVASYQQAIVLKADFPQLHYNLGLTLQELGRLDEAEASYRRAIALKPDYIEAHSSLLKCLYLLDEESFFVDQLDFLINQDKANAVIGSLTCRSALKYGLEKPNLFCREPLKYVSHIDLKTQYDFGKVFVENVKSILDDNKISNRKQSLLVNGYQTSGNLFDIENSFTEKIQKAIRLEIEKYRINFKNSEEGLIKKWPAEYSLYGWLISMKSGGELQPHIHDQGWLSGSIYINVPPKSKADSGSLVVSLGEENDATDTRVNVEKIINVVTGSLVLFPGSLTHYTIPFEAEEERIVLAFDVKKND